MRALVFCLRQPEDRLFGRFGTTCIAPFLLAQYAVRLELPSLHAYQADNFFTNRIKALTEGTEMCRMFKICEII